MNNEDYTKDEHINGDDDWAQAPPEQLIEYYNRQKEDYISGLTMPSGIPVRGNLAAWNDYCETLAFMQLGANNDENYDSKYNRCISYFKSTYEKMSIMRLLYLQHSVSSEYTKSFICKRLNLSRGFVHKVIEDAVAENWVINDAKSVRLTQHGIEAFRHYAMRWWQANENSGLSGQYFRVWHSRNAVYVKDKIRHQYLQNVGGAI
jgi:predicted transcriptional regulator